MLIKERFKSLKEKIVKTFLKNKSSKRKSKKNNKKKNLNIIDKDDIKSIKSYFFDIAFYGITLNFALFVIFGIDFNFYSWIGWGFAVHLLDYKVTKFFRKLLVKK